MKILLTALCYRLTGTIDVPDNTDMFLKFSIEHDDLHYIDNPEVASNAPHFKVATFKNTGSFVSYTGKGKREHLKQYDLVDIS